MSIPPWNSCGCYGKGDQVVFDGFIYEYTWRERIQFDRDKRLAMIPSVSGLWKEIGPVHRPINELVRRLDLWHEAYHGTPNPNPSIYLKAAANALEASERVLEMVQQGIVNQDRVQQALDLIRNPVRTSQ